MATSVMQKKREMLSCHLILYILTSVIEAPSER